MRLALVVTACLVCPSLIGQIVTDSVYFKDEHYFDPYSSSCEQMATKRAKLADNYKTYLDKAQLQLDSLNDADFPCYEYAFKTYFLEYFRGNDTWNEKGCTGEHDPLSYAPHEFAIVTVRTLRDRKLDDREARKVDCSEQMK